MPGSAAVPPHVTVRAPQGQPLTPQKPFDKPAEKVLPPRAQQGPQSAPLTTDALETAMVDTPLPPAAVPIVKAGAVTQRMNDNRPPPVRLPPESQASRITILPHSPEGKAETDAVQPRPPKPVQPVQKHFDETFNVAKNVYDNKVHMLEQDIYNFRNDRTWSFLFVDSTNLLGRIDAHKVNLGPMHQLPALLAGMSIAQLSEASDNLDACSGLADRLLATSKQYGHKRAARASEDTQTKVRDRLASLEAEVNPFINQCNREAVAVKTELLKRPQAQLAT